jgi:hypothetical protein
MAKKFIPILFSTPMVKALLDGRKTMTRRTIKGFTYKINEHGNYNYDYVKSKNVCHLATNSDVALMNDPLFGLVDYCPYGKVGDVLWVRETHYRYGRWVKDGISKKGKQKWKFVHFKDVSEIKFVNNPPALVAKNAFRETAWYKRNSLFMPKSATRIFLLNEGVKVERLHDISENDAVKEGVLRRDLFLELWMSINGMESLNANPFVWAVSFKKIEKPEDFK